jgi:hypothetical protein
MIRAIGIDAAFANMGLARVRIVPPRWPGADRRDPQVFCEELQLVSTESQAGKTVRKSSDSLRRAIELHRALHAFIGDAQVIFAEVPSGAQSAAAAQALGIAVGILASSPIPIIEVNPQETRFVVAGSKRKVTKDEAIQWAIKHWPDAPWVRHAKAGRVIGKNKKLISSWKAGDPQNCNEHLADAMATIAAGIKTPAFQQLMALHATTSPTDHRSSPRRVALD